MFIEQGVRATNRFWKYIVGSVVVILASVLGQVPLLVALKMDTATSVASVSLDSESVLHHFEPNISLFLVLLSFVFAMLGFYFVVTKLHQQRFLSVTTSRSKVDWGRIFFAFGLWSLFTIVATIVYYQLDPQSYQWNFKPVPFAILVVIAVVLIPFQTSTEEYVFRGYLMQGFANLSGNKWFPLLMTSVIFGGLHLFNPEVAKLGNIIFVYYIGTGLFLGILTLMDEGLELALGFHAANNCIGALLITSDWSAFQTHSILKEVAAPQSGLDVILPVVVVYPILLYIFSCKYQWTNWKQKLTAKIAPPKF
ncbi:CPBP family intramembrane glutamic endopeptidase [Flavobacterium crassostreae]|uniref:Abortive phage infection protein n=1 Tax=Flavobacterium crassostreae TaxID=1763534 RepID=A0A1B9E9Q3_9FLAO|nr:CPBP family intramembrane glutamic endopeptidase [Flavobacterium crassostreae]OCB78663.1 abortive phage infection protein [Flavobacterium crassostreae]